MDPEKIGKAIRNLRRKKRLTQQEFANIFHVSYQAVSKWETGKSLPDVVILKEICDTFKLSFDELVFGKTKKKKNYILLLSFFVILFIVGLFLFFHSNNFTFKTISSNCDNFIISGSMAYNDSKSSIYISSINYCGNEKQKYDSINCTLYEQTDRTLVKVKECEEKTYLTLSEFLDNLTFYIDDYETTCKNYTTNSLYILIDTTKDGINETMKVPLKLEDKCE